MPRCALVTLSLLLASLVTPAFAASDSLSVEHDAGVNRAANVHSGVRMPLYLEAGVPSEQAAWVREAIQLASEGAPRVTGLSLPGAEIPLFVASDGEQFRARAQELIGALPSAGSAGCLTRVANGSRAVICYARTWDSPAHVIHHVTHELTHQLVQGDLERARPVANWYKDGLAEYVASEVVARRQPGYVAEQWRERRQHVASALCGGEYRHLEDLSTGALWNGAADLPLAYAQSALAVRSLVERHSMDAVAEVVRQTAAPGSFPTAFTRVFGYTPAEFARGLEAALRADLAAACPLG
jgi:hypothetical protein